ncbi:S41 family peptidase [Sphingomonas sp. TREG-RG-20F-R18-01]|uniref:S41 family peptidase n=1 Tax=Sphingomonas sp. TREG-RG-20F-R18-01 TaxID=2914982 RepID=UPI001F5996B7|nr:S41 family peptidase [Sphingomonas sp. TREG-RG-20F-R18-01]
MTYLDRRHVLMGASGLFATALLPAPAKATDELLAPAAMQADIAILFDAYASLHPGLYRYLTPLEFQRGRQRLDRFAGTPRTLGDFYLALTAFTASIRCGHSYPNPANQTPAVASALFGKPDRLPFAFVWLDRRMIVTADLGSGHHLPAGSEVVAIDGIGARDILTKMLPYARTDGSNDARKVADLGIPGDADQPAFDVLRALLFPSSRPSARVVVRADGRTVMITCPLMTAAARDAALRRPFTDSPYGWTFDVRGHVCVLTMPTWAVFHDKWDWRGFIDASVDTAVDRNLSGIVIDVRDNGGGLDCGSAIISRLIEAPLSADSYSRHVRYRKIPDRLAPHLKTWDRSFKDWGESVIGPDAAGFYTLTRPGDASDTDTIQPTGQRFQGKVAVLVGPKNASATFGFASLMRRHRLGTLIGEQTGGNRRGINGGAFFFVGLPGSSVEVDLPLIAYWPDTPQPDAGIMPDLIVPALTADLKAGRDTALARALLIASN